MTERHERLRQARIAAGFDRQRDVIERFPAWGRNSYKSHENGNAPFSYDKAKIYAAGLKVRAEWLYAGTGPMRETTPMVRIVGRVGANSDGSIVYVTGHEAYDYVPAPPGAKPGCAALEVVGDSQMPVILSGSIVFFQDQLPEPTSAMIGTFPAVVETTAGEVLLKRIQRGSQPGLYNLESMNASTIHDKQIKWCAEVMTVYGPSIAQELVVRAAEAA